MNTNFFNSFSDIIRSKYSAFHYIKSKRILQKIENTDKQLIDNQEIEKLSDLVIKSFVPYLPPWKKLTSNYNIIFNAKGDFNELKK